MSIKGHRIEKGEIWYPSSKISKLSQDDIKILMDKGQELVDLEYPIYDDGEIHIGLNKKDYQTYLDRKFKKYIHTPDKKVLLLRKVHANSGKIDTDWGTYKNGELVAFEVEKQNFYLDCSKANYKTDGTDKNGLYDYMGVLENGYSIGVPFGAEWEVKSEIVDDYIDITMGSNTYSGGGISCNGLPFIGGSSYTIVDTTRKPISKNFRYEYIDEDFFGFFNGPYMKHLVGLQERMFELENQGKIKIKNGAENIERSPKVSEGTKILAKRFQKLMAQYNIEKDGPERRMLGNDIDKICNALGWGNPYEK